MTKNEKWIAIIFAIALTFLGIINLFGIAVIWGIIAGIYFGMIWFIKTKN